MKDTSKFKITRDKKLCNVIVADMFVLPYMDPSIRPTIGLPGALGYNKPLDLVYYSDGTKWIPLLPGSSAGNKSLSFALTKRSSQLINRLTSTILVDWDISYDHTSNWNAVTGTYTADSVQQLLLDIDISWDKDVSNTGVRNIKVLLNGVTIKEGSTQANPDKAIDTTQHASFAIDLVPLDIINIVVEHTAKTPLIIKDGFYTTVSGFIIK